MNTFVQWQWITAGGLHKWVMLWLGGMVVMMALTGCSGEALEAQADYHAALAQATATASHAHQAQSQAASVVSDAAAQATQVKAEFNYAGKQAENRAFTTIELGWLGLLIIVAITALAVVRYASYLKWKIELEEHFIFSSEQQSKPRR